MWKFSSATGKFYARDIDTSPMVVGYSGYGAYRNRQDMEHIPNVGPIPRGTYHIEPARDDPGHLGPVVMNLTPQPGTNTFGRSLFRIHGDNAEHNASHGCIILPKAVRLAIAESADRMLVVV